MPEVCAMSVLAALPFLVFLQPGWALMLTLNGESISTHRNGSRCHFGRGKNDAKRAQQPWHRLRGHAWLPQTLLQTSALWERWLCAGVLPGIGHGTVRAELAQLLQLGSTLAELGEPSMTPHLSQFTACARLLMLLQVCGVQ